jgi:hypothetical protein
LVDEVEVVVVTFAAGAWINPPSAAFDANPEEAIPPMVLYPAIEVSAELLDWVVPSL